MHLIVRLNAIKVFQMQWGTVLGFQDFPFITQADKNELFFVTKDRCRLSRRILISYKWIHYPNFSYTSGFRDILT